MTWFRRWQFAGRLAIRELARHRRSTILSVLAMALPVSAVVAVALVAPNSVASFGDGASSGTSDISGFRPGEAAGIIAVAAQFAMLALVLVGAMVAATMLVSAQRMERTLALLAGIGAPPKTLGRIMSASGLIIGAFAALVAVVLGSVIGVALLAAQSVSLRTINASVIILIALATIGVGWLTSLTAAYRASATNVALVLRDAPRPVQAHRRFLRLGHLLTVCGFGVFILGCALGLASMTFPSGIAAGLLRVGSTLLTTPAAIAILIGALLMLPEMFRRIGLAPGKLPGITGFAARLAAREVERGGKRARAAGGSIMLVTFLLGGYLTLFAVNANLSVEHHDWRLQQDQVSAELVVQTAFDPIKRGVVDDPDAVAAALSRGLDAQTRVLDGVLGPFWGYPVDDDEGYSGRQPMEFPADGLPQPRLAGGDTSACDLPFATTGLTEALCTPAAFGQFEFSPTRPAIWVGDDVDLALILGRAPDDTTRAALADGTAIVLDPRYLAVDERGDTRGTRGTSGTVTIDWWGAQQFVPENQPGEFRPAGMPLRSVKLDGLRVPMEHRIAFGLFLSPEAAGNAGLQPMPASVLAQARPDLTYDDVNAVDLSAFNEQVYLEIETGPSLGDPAWRWGAVILAAGLTLAIALASIGLSRAEGRRVDSTLAALGASRDIRRLINGWYALFIVGTTALIGTLGGALTVIGTSLAVGSTAAALAPALPLVDLAIIGIVVPLIVALIARLARPATVASS